MEKKLWKAPKVFSLGANKTNYGTNITKKPDATISVGGHTFFSFS